MIFSLARHITQTLARPAGIALLTGLALAPLSATHAQCTLSASISAGQPLTVCAGGSLTLAAQATVAGFLDNAGLDGPVQAVLVQPDGKILVGGSFITHAGSYVQHDLIRLNPDGTRDLAFLPVPASAAATGTTMGFQLGNPALFNTGFVNALALQPDGKIIVGGKFDRVNGTPSSSIVRLNGTDGSIDYTFRPTSPAGFGLTGASFGVSPSVNALALQPDGKVLVGGDFNAYAGAAIPPNLARLNADGTYDTSFALPAAGLASPNFYAGVDAIAVQPDGKVLVGGNFTTYGNVNVPDRLMRLNANGSRDASFNPFTPVATAGFDNVVATLLLQPDGKVLVGGRFTTYNGVDVPDGLVRLNTDGTRDAGFLAGTGFGAGAVSNSVLALVRQPDGKLVVGGDFATLHGAAVSAALVRLNGTDGSRDATFNAGGTGVTAGTFTSTLHDIRALALQADSKILAGGYVDRYNGRDTPSNLLRVNADGSSNVGPQPVAGASYTWSTGATGPSLAVSQPGVYTATATSGGCTATSLAVRVYAATPAAVRVTPAGPLSVPAGGSATLTAAAVVPGFNVGGTMFDGNSESLLAVLPLPDGKTLIGGSFGSYSGNSAAPDCLLRLNADGTLDNTFNAGGTGFDSFVSCLAVQPDGKIVVGGAFSAYNGNAAAPDCLLRLNADGSLDPSFVPYMVLGRVGNSATIQTVCLQPDGKVLVGGTGTFIASAFQGNSLVRLNPDGSKDTDFNRGGAGYPSTVHKILLQPNGRILVGGHYGNYNYVSYGNPPGVSRLYADGTLDLTFNYNIATGNGVTGGSAVYDIALQPDGKVVVGGYFTAYNNTAIPVGLLRLNANGSLDTAFNPGGTGVDSNVEVLALQPDGKIVAGGEFTTYNGSAAVPDALFRFNANGSPDNTFNSGGAGMSGSGRSVRALAIQADGRILAGGNFTNYNGAPAGSFCRVNPNGTLNNADAPLAGATYAWSPGGSTGPTLAVTASGTYTATATVPGSCGGASAPVAVTVVATPASSSLTVPANGTYGPLAGAALNTLAFTLTFNQPITVTGTPQLALTIGSASRLASYVSGSGTAALLFRYNVVAGDLDTDGIALTALALNGGTLRNSAGTNAALTLPTVPSLTAVLVDGVAPVVASSTRLAPATAFTNSTTASFQLVFSEAVTGVDASDFTLTAGGTATGTVSSVSGSGSTYTITVNAPTGNGTLRLDLNASGTGIADAASNALGGGYTAGQAFSFDRTAPVTVRTGQPANPTVSTTATFTFAATDATVGGISSGVARYEASLDGGAFATATSPATYTGLSTGSHSFALRAVDNAGNAETAAPAYVWLIQPLATAPAELAAAVTLHPNPAGAGTRVVLMLAPAAGRPARAEVFNALGQRVLPAQVLTPAGLRATVELPTAGLPAGVYTVRLTTSEGAVSKRLVVQ